jgi:hypothetical protein
VVEVGTGEEAEHADGVQAHQHANHQDEDEPQEGRRRGPILGQSGRQWKKQPTHKQAPDSRSRSSVPERDRARSLSQAKNKISFSVR